MEPFDAHLQLSRHVLAFQSKEFGVQYSPQPYLCPVDHYTSLQGVFLIEFEF